MAIGYVGLGNMGGALARRLQLTHQLIVYDRDDAAVERMNQLGAAAAGSLAELASQCETILLCLPTSAQVRDVLMGSKGIAESAQHGTVVIDQTSGDPNVTRALAIDLLERGVKLIDAPVSGGIKGAEAGTIAIMVGSSDEQFAAVQALLHAISPNVFHAGGVGNGHIMKLVNNLISTTTRLLTFEAMSLAQKNGVDPKTAAEILLASGGKNVFIERILAPQILNGNLVAGYTLGLAHKDVSIACQLGSDSGVPMFYGNLTSELYQMFMNEKGYGAQVDTAALVVDRLAGSKFIPDGYREE